MGIFLPKKIDYWYINSFIGTL